MASQVNKTVGLGTRLFNAFRSWYIYASGYRQLGKHPFTWPSVFQLIIGQDLPNCLENDFLGRSFSNLSCVVVR